MIAYPDTSFLCALYVRQDNSAQAAVYFAAMPEPLHLTSLVLYEFRQSVRFQIWLHSRDKNKGYPLSVGEAALQKLQMNIEGGSLVMISADWPDIHSRAEEISKRQTISGGHRTLDILHLATALHLGAKEFLTFDTNQRKLATALKMKVRP